MNQMIDRVQEVGAKVEQKVTYYGQKFMWRAKESLLDTQGIGVVEVILILVVLIGLVLIFKSQLTTLVGDIFDTITSESSNV